MCCKVCTAPANLILCGGRLCLEKNIGKKIITVKHYGEHACPQVSVSGRPDKEKIESLIATVPKITCESIVRQIVGNHIEKGDFNAAVEEAKSYTDTKYIENIKSKMRSASRPYGHSFDAVSRIKESRDLQDKFLVYKIDDGSDTNIPYVMKSSRRKVQTMLNMDKEGNHPLASECVHLDVIQSRCKGWQTYTLSYYDVPLLCMIKLCTMDTIAECKETYAIFLKNINYMLKDFIVDNEPDTEAANRFFNPYHLKDDEAGRNKTAMCEVFGEGFVENLSVGRHKKLVRKDNRESYQTCHDLKNAPTEEEYARRKVLLEMLIDSQMETNKQSVFCILR